jgi:hypothetical protein
LLVYGKATSFCLLILYSATLPKVLIKSRFWQSLVSLKCRVLSTANRDNLTSSFPTYGFLPFKEFTIQWK